MNKICASSYADVQNITFLFHISLTFTNQNWLVKELEMKCMYIACLCQT